MLTLHSHKGYPIVTVPLAFYPEDVTIKSAGLLIVYPTPGGVPFGLAFLGSAFSELKFTGFAHLGEQAVKTSPARKALPMTVPKMQYP